MSLSENSLWYVMCLLLSVSSGSTRSVNVNDISETVVERSRFGNGLGHFPHLLTPKGKCKGERQERDVEDYGDYQVDKDLPDFNKAQLHLFSWWKGSNEKINSSTPSGNKLLGPDAPGSVAPPSLASPAPNGNLPAPNGSLPAPNGSLSAPNGSLPAPNGSLPATNASLPADPNMSTPSANPLNGTITPGNATAAQSGDVPAALANTTTNGNSSVAPVTGISSNGTAAASTPALSDTSTASTYLTTCYTVTDTCLPLITLVAAPICTDDNTTGTLSTTLLTTAATNASDVKGSNATSTNASDVNGLTTGPATQSSINATTLSGNGSVTASGLVNGSVPDTGSTGLADKSSPLPVLLQLAQQAPANGTMLIPVYQVPQVTQLILLNNHPLEESALITNNTGIEEMKSTVKNYKNPLESVLEDDESNLIQKKVQYNRAAHRTKSNNIQSTQHISSQITFQSYDSTTKSTGLLELHGPEALDQKLVSLIKNNEKGKNVDNTNISSSQDSSKTLHHDNSREIAPSKAEPNNSQEISYLKHNAINSDFISSYNMVSDSTARNLEKGKSFEASLPFQSSYSNSDEGDAQFSNISSRQLKDEGGHQKPLNNSSMDVHNKLTKLSSEGKVAQNYVKDGNKDQYCSVVGMERNAQNNIFKKAVQNPAITSIDDKNPIKMEPLQNENSLNENVSIGINSVLITEASFITVNGANSPKASGGLTLNHFTNSQEAIFLERKNKSTPKNNEERKNSNSSLDQITNGEDINVNSLAFPNGSGDNLIYTGSNSHLANSHRSTKTQNVSPYDEKNAKSSLRTNMHLSNERNYNYLSPTGYSNLRNFPLKGKPKDSMNSDQNGETFLHYDGPNSSTNLDKAQSVGVYFKYNDTFLAQHSKNGRNLIDICKNITCRAGDYLAQCCGQKSFTSSKCQGEDFSYLLPIPGDTTTTSIKPSRQGKGNQMSLDEADDSRFKLPVKANRSSNARVTRENNMNDFVKFQLMHGLTSPDGKDLINALKVAKLQMQKVSKEFRPQTAINNIQMPNQSPIVERQINSAKQSENIPTFLDTNKILENLRATITESLLQTKLSSNPMEKYRAIRNQGLIPQTDLLQENIILDKLREETEEELKRISQLEMRRLQEEEMFNKEKERYLKELNAIRDLIQKENENQKVSDSEKRDVVNYPQLVPLTENGEGNMKESSYSKLVHQIGSSVKSNEAKELIFDRYSEVKNSNGTKCQSPQVLYLKENNFPELELKKSINVPNGISFPIIKLDSENVEDKRRVKRGNLGKETEDTLNLNGQNNDKSLITINDKIAQNFECLHDDLFGLQKFIASKVNDGQVSMPLLQKPGIFVNKSNLS